MHDNLQQLTKVFQLKLFDHIYSYRSLGIEEINGMASIFRALDINMNHLFDIVMLHV